jgi:site-specific recombinase XerD
VSELLALQLDEITFRDRYVDLYIRGKGRRERVLTLWKVVGDSIRAWLAVRGRDGVPELFVNARGEAMTRSGAEYILRKHVTAASVGCPSLTTKRVSPHVLRHTSAMNTLRATRDIRKSRSGLATPTPRAPRST